METRPTYSDGAEYQQWPGQQETAPPRAHPYSRQYTVLSTRDKLFGSHSLEGDRARLIQQTYLLLAVGVFAALVGGWLGEHSRMVLEFYFSNGIFPWILTMAALYMTPKICMNIAQNNPRMAAPGLALVGFVSGVSLAPLLFIAAVKSVGLQGPDLVQTALVITGATFAAITAYIWMSGKQFSAPKALMAGVFVTLAVAIPLNFMWLHNSVFGLIINVGIGLFGAAILVIQTSQVLHNPNFNSPVYGALTLFAGLYDVFQAVLWILIGRRR